MNKRRLFGSSLLLVGLAAAVGLAEKNDAAAVPGWRVEFRAMSPKWEVRGKPGVKNATFEIAQPEGCATSCLVMKSDNASASLLIEVGAVDLKQTPILRWRWRVTEYPKAADGRDPAKDDQAIGIYVNTGSMLNQKSIAYPVGSTGMVTYAAGMVKVKWFALRNQKNGDGKTFLVEERNLAEDLKTAFDALPGKIGIGISCNSQYTGTKAEANLDWIELVPLPTNAAAAK
jgi:hypothetical protein